MNTNSQIKMAIHGQGQVSTFNSAQAIRKLILLWRFLLISATVIEELSSEQTDKDSGLHIVVVTEISRYTIRTNGNGNGNGSVALPSSGQASPNLNATRSQQILWRGTSSAVSTTEQR